MVPLTFDTWQRDDLHPLVYMCLCLCMSGRKLPRSDGENFSTWRSRWLPRYMYRLWRLLRHIRAVLRRSGSLSLDARITPDTSLHVTRAGGKQMTCWTWCNRDHTVLVALQHHLSVACGRIPELDTTVLGAGHDPLTAGSQAD